MNYYGSYRNLFRNAKAALLAAVEIYNKPQMPYRDECFVILLLNAWELLLKAILSKKHISIYYRKKRNEPYRTITWADALKKCQQYFSYNAMPITKNIELLSTYRDNAVHFYNQGEMGVLIYSLAQTAVVNFRDIAETQFGENIGDEMTWQLLPIGIKTPVDPISFLKKKRDTTTDKSPIGQFIVRLADATKEVEDGGGDTGRLMTVFTLKLESTKKITNADVVVGVTGAQEGLITTIVKPSDPNVTHPYRQKEMVAALKEKFGTDFSPHKYQCLVWRYKIKEQPHYCWRAASGVLTLYSADALTFLKKLSISDVETAVSERKSSQKKSPTPA